MFEEYWFDFCSRGMTYFLLQSVHTDWGLQPASYSMGIGGLSPWVKRPDREADRSPPPSSNSKVKIEWNYTFIPPYTFMACIGMLYTFMYLYRVQNGIHI